MEGEGAQNDENDLLHFKSNKGYDNLMNNDFYSLGIALTMKLFTGNVNNSL